MGKSVGTENVGKGVATGTVGIDGSASVGWCVGFETVGNDEETSSETDAGSNGAISVGNMVGYGMVGNAETYVGYGDINGATSVGYSVGAGFVGNSVSI